MCIHVCRVALAFVLEAQLFVSLIFFCNSQLKIIELVEILQLCLEMYVFYRLQDAVSTLSPADMYTCFVISLPGSYSVNIALENSTYQVGAVMRMICRVAGDSRDVQTRWLKNGFPLLEDEDEDRIQTTSDGELRVEDVKMSDAGSYTCSALREGEEASQTVTVEITGKQNGTLHTEMSGRTVRNHPWTLI